MKKTFEWYLVKDKNDDNPYLYQTEPFCEHGNWETNIDDGMYWDELMMIPDVFPNMSRDKSYKCKVTIEIDEHQ